MNRTAAIAAFALVSGNASAQPPAQVQWELIAASPQQVIFFDARPDRIDSSVESSTVFTFHVLKTPMKSPDGKPYTMYMQRTKFSCLKPEMSREYVVTYDDAWNRVFTDDAVLPMAPFQPGSVSESISIMACDHFNPTDFSDKFTDRDQALAFAKAKLSGS